MALFNYAPPKQKSQEKSDLTRRTKSATAVRELTARFPLPY
jgi:hypothetical protein